MPKVRFDGKSGPMTTDTVGRSHKMRRVKPEPALGTVCPCFEESLLQMLCPDGACTISSFITLHTVLQTLFTSQLPARYAAGAIHLQLSGVKGT